MLRRFSFPAILLLLLISAGSMAQENTAGSKRTPVYTERGSEGCLVCHSGPKMHAVAAGAHGQLEESGADLGAHGCEACHGAGSIHVSRAHGGRGFPPMRTFGRGSDVGPRAEQLNACLACHAEETGSTHAIEFIGSPHDRGPLNCSSCHQVHVEDDPMNDRETQAETCFRCHRKQKTEHPRFEGKSIDFDALTCGTCHDVHKVLEDDV